MERTVPITGANSGLGKETYGRALTVGRSAIRYPVGIDARVLPIVDRLTPTGLQDRLQRRALGRN